jgi:hypothetical protein
MDEDAGLELVNKFSLLFGASPCAMIYSDNRHIDLFPLDGLLYIPKSTNATQFSMTKEIYVCNTSM